MKEGIQAKRLQACLGVGVGLVTCGLCLQVFLHHSVIGAALPLGIGLATAVVVALGGVAPLFVEEGRRRGRVEREGALGKAVDVFSDWLFFTMLLLVLFSCSVVMQFNTGHGRASSVYYQAFALSAIGMGSLYVGVMYLATVYYPFERKVDWMWVQGAIALLLLLVVLHWEREGRLQWHKGLHLEGIPHSGAIEPEASHCQIGLNYWRLRFAFPKRFFNVWAGSLQCSPGPRPEMHLRSLPDGSGRELILECKKGEAATYVEDYPFLRSTTPWLKERFPRERVERAMAAVAEVKAYDREHPPVITGQHVQGFCGLREAALVHAVPAAVVPQRARKRKLNVLLVMLDAVSRAEFHHSMPTTGRKLEEINNNPLFPFSVFEFYRYMTTGKTTRPNLTSLLSGMSQPMREKHVAAWEKGKPSPESRLGLIFRQFKKQHQQEMFPGRELEGPDYTTALLLGFCNAQLEEYWNTTIAEQLIDVDLSEFFCHSDFTGETLDNPFKGPYSSSRRCIAGKAVHSYLFEMMNSLLENAARKDAPPAFIKSEFLEGHETSLEVLSVVDEELADFLDGVAETHPDTFIMLYSDHGNHMTMLANYPGGRQEQGLGSLFVLSPNWLFDDNPAFRTNLAENQQKIVTMTDMYATLLDLSVLYGPAPAMPPISDKPQKLFTSRLGRAEGGLLRPLPDRDCKTARVPSTRCRCEPL